MFEIMYDFTQYPMSNEEKIIQFVESLKDSKDYYDISDDENLLAKFIQDEIENNFSHGNVYVKPEDYYSEGEKKRVIIVKLED